MPNSVLKVEHLDKSFSGIQVLYDVNFQINSGDVIGLAGENGAGKSTIMKSIAGTNIPDSNKSRISIDGEEIPYGDPLKIQRMGVSVIYQELSLIPELSVAENLFMRQMSTKKRLAKVNWNQMYEECDAYLKSIGALGIDPRVNVSTLGIAKKQFVEIAKAVSVNPKFLLMDEPSATLNAVETENLFKIVEKLKKEDVGVVYITHRMEELFEVCNRLIILKDGAVVDDRGMEGITKNDIINKMVGRKVETFFVQREHNQKDNETALSVKNLRSDAGVHDVSFELKKGEILGVAGLNGAGRSEMIRAVCGLDHGTADEMKIHGKQVKNNGILDAMKNGIAYLPEERKTQGISLLMSVKENMSYAALKKFCNHGIINRAKELKACDAMIQSMNVKCSGPDQLIRNLSGGNQQKVIIGKWMLNEPDIYLMDEPTRGIDVGAKHEIYELMKKITDQGASIVFISSELPELLGVCDRILVIAGGTVTGQLDIAEATEEKVMSYAFAAQKKEEG